MTDPVDRDHPGMTPVQRAELALLLSEYKRLKRDQEAGHPPVASTFKERLIAKEKSIHDKAIFFAFCVIMVVLPLLFIIACINFYTINFRGR